MRSFKSLRTGILAGCAFLMAGFGQTVLAQDINSAYFNWFGHTDGVKGNYISGGVWNDLTKAPITGSNGAWTLGPNFSLCGDNRATGTAADITYWCTDKKYVEMLTYENQTVAAGAPSKWNFKGCFGPATGMTGLKVSAFVKILSSNYADTYAFQSSDAACWDFSLDILGDVTVQAQRGFIVEGLNSDPTVDAAGSIIAYEGTTVAPGFSQFAPGIPALPLGGLLGLIALVGWMGMRRR